MEGYSKYFTFEELTDSVSFPELVSNNRKHAMQFINAGKRLSKLLESIRHVLGDNPINATSGFRNKTLNIAVGSKAKNSAHQRFEAADIEPNGISIKEAFTSIIMAQRAGLLPDMRKLIREDHKGILHIEVKMKADEVIEFYTTSDNIKFKKVV
jgi:hypothetical protein